MPSEARQKKIMEKLNRAQKCSILGPQNLGSGGGPGPPGPPPGSAPVRHIICAPATKTQVLQSNWYIFITLISQTAPHPISRVCFE